MSRYGRRAACELDIKFLTTKALETIRFVANVVMSSFYYNRIALRIFIFFDNI